MQLGWPFGAADGQGGGQAFGPGHGGGQDWLGGTGAPTAPLDDVVAAGHGCGQAEAGEAAWPAVLPSAGWAGGAVPIPPSGSVG